MKGEHTIAEFIEHCNRIVNIWPSPSNEVPENPLKEFIANGGLDRHEERTHWKGSGLYYAILTGSAEAFYEENKDIMPSAEFDTLSQEIKETEKTHAVQRLQKLIRALKQRRIRLRQKITGE
jgi:rubrerythrin